MSKFYEFVEEVIHIEGGYTNNPHDSGGPTKYGITQKVARKNGYSGDMKDLTRDRALSIYKKKYWDSLELDTISDIHQALAYELFDTGVNAGIDTSGEFLQRVLNALNRRQELYKDITVDGDIGPITISTLNKYYSHRGAKGIIVLIVYLDSLQGSKYINLAERREKDEEFVYGWGANRLLNYLKFFNEKELKDIL